MAALSTRKSIWTPLTDEMSAPTPWWQPISHNTTASHSADECRPCVLGLLDDTRRCLMPFVDDSGAGGGLRCLCDGVARATLELTGPTINLVWCLVFKKPYTYRWWWWCEEATAITFMRLPAVYLKANDGEGWNMGVCCVCVCVREGESTGACIKAYVIL